MNNDLKSMTYTRTETESWNERTNRVNHKISYVVRDVNGNELARFQRACEAKDFIKYGPQEIAGFGEV